jgi:GT2 family glycosyltransferase
MSVNGFDETFDFLDADMDFSWSVLEKGWYNAVDDRLLCFHPGGGSPQSTGKRVLRHHQNRWRLLTKHHQITSPRLAKAGLFTRHLFETLSLALLSITPFRSRFLPKLKTRVTLLQTVGTEYQPSVS